MSVLKEIVENRKKTLPKAAELNGRAEPVQKDIPALLKRRENGPGLIAEIKRKSPSRGSINPGMNVERALELYTPYASAISVLTEPDFFGGSLDDLRLARRLTGLPLLRKDFIIDPLQVKEARLNGADFFLLMMSILEKNQMSELIDAGREFQMEALVEVHDEAELESALDLDIRILGINNRNLHDLSIDLNTTAELLAKIPSDVLPGLTIVSESGLSSRRDIESLPSRIDSTLIGTAFMKSDNPEALLSEMFSP